MKNIIYKVSRKIPKNCTYSVRIQLVQQEVKVDKNTGTMKTLYVPTQSIYNPAPGTSPLLRTIYTKISLGATMKNNAIDLDQGLYMRDQVKIRLPMVLDGSHFIQLSLFLVEFKNHSNGEDKRGCGQALVAESKIPLSSSSNSKESKFGSRITTVIPNGLYRIKMGEFQLQLETRLASTVHISDPGVATIIRDFNSHYQEDLSVETSSNYQSILSKASEQSITSHFLPLVLLHFRYLASNPIPAFDHGENLSRSHAIERLMMKGIRGLFEVLRKIRKKFQLEQCNEQIQKHFKDFFDLFDDGHFSNEIKDQALSTSSSSFDLHYDSGEFESKPENYKGQGKNTTIVEATRRRAGISKDGIRREQEVVREMVPFTRKAYGASKIDRMKAEAELYESGQILSELVDDDETVMTASTWQSHSRAINSGTSVATFDRNYWPGDKNGNISSPVKDKTIHKTHVPQYEPEKAAMNNNPFEKARTMAKRVNSVAQVFIAPCVAPNVTMQHFNESAVRTPVRKKLSRYRGDRKVPDENREVSVENKYRNSNSLQVC